MDDDIFSCLPSGRGRDGRGKNGVCIVGNSFAVLVTGDTIGASKVGLASVSKVT